MTENEKLIWAAVYAVEWSYAYHTEQQQFGIPLEKNISTCIENASAAVEYARDALPVLKEEGWGEKDDVYLRLKDMLSYD